MDWLFIAAAILMLGPVVAFILLVVFGRGNPKAERRPPDPAKCRHSHRLPAGAALGGYQLEACARCGILFLRGYQNKWK